MGKLDFGLRVRNSLRSTLSKQQAITKDNTSSISHTNYSHLTSAEKDARLKNLHDSLKVATRKLSTLEGKIKRIMETQAIHLEGNDNSDISSIVSDVTPLVEKNYPPNTPQRIFWDQQILFNSLKNPRQMKWHPFMIRFALNLKYLSTSAYKALCLSGVIHLLSERTLSDYTHWTTPHSGVQLEFIEELSRSLNELPSGQQCCALSMDEMKIKSGLVFEKHSGTLVGFTDLGSVNRDIEMLLHSDNESNERNLAKHAFVFLVLGNCMVL